MVTKPNPYIKKICSFLNTKETLFTSTMLKRENVPRNIRYNLVKDKLQDIQKLASTNSYDLLIKMAEDYETIGTLNDSQL